MTGPGQEDDLPFTGERFVPGTRGEIWIEHWHRYHFATRWTAGRRVLDIACGEGYGSALLARSASHVTGVDVSADAIAHASRVYAAFPNATFLTGSCTRIPLADASVEVAISFETLEHIGEQEAFLDELARVLVPEGVLVLSCPNKLEYSEKRGFQNEFHVKELYREELEPLVRSRFPECDWYGQRPAFYSVIAPQRAAPWAGQLAEVSEGAPGEASARISNPLYFLVAASRSRGALMPVAPALSVLADRDDWVHRDYEKVMRELEGCVARADALDRELVSRDRVIAALQDEIRTLRRQKDLDDKALEERAAAILHRDALAAAKDLELQRLGRQIEAKDLEILRRQGLRWWLKLPFVRFGLSK